MRDNHAEIREKTIRNYAIIISVSLLVLSCSAGLLQGAETSAPSYWAELAEVHLRHDHPDEAIPLLRRAIGESEDEQLRLRWQIWLASALMKSGKEGEGVSILEMLIETEDAAIQMQATHRLAEFFMFGGEMQEAIELYEKVALRAPGKFQRGIAQRKLAELAKSLPDQIILLERYEAMLRDDPENRELQELLFALNKSLGLPGRAVEIARQLHIDAPADQELWMKYADMVFVAGLLDEATDEYEKMIETAPALRQRACEQMARIALKREKPERAAEWAAKSTEHLPDNHYTQLHLGKFYASLGLLSNAEAELRRASASAKSDSRRATAALELAGVLIRLSKNEEALVLLEPLAKDETMPIFKRLAEELIERLR